MSQRDGDQRTPVLEYRGLDEPPEQESWLASATFSVLACAFVLGGVAVLVSELLGYLLSPVQH